MKRLLRNLARSFTALALILGAGLVTLLVLESTGVLRSRLEAELVNLLAEEPDLNITLRELSVDWFSPSLTLRGLHITGAKGEAHIEQVDCYLDLSSGAPSIISAVHVESGRLLLERDFIEACTRAIAKVEQKLLERFGVSVDPDVDDRDPDVDQVSFPTLTLHGIEIALRLVDGPLVELGRGQARLELNADEDLTLVGSMALPQEGSSPLPIFARVTLTENDQLQIAAAARNLRVSGGRTSPFRALFPPALQQLDATMKLSTDFTMTLDPSGARPPVAQANVRIEEGRLRASTDLPPLEDVAITGDFSWQPRAMISADSDLNELWQTLTVRADVQAKLLGETMTGAARLSQDGSLEARLGAKDVAIDERLLVDAGIPPEDPLRQTWVALGIGGSADVNLGLRMPLTGEFQAGRDLDIALDVRTNRKGKFCYFGWDLDGPDGDYEREGIPLPCDQVSGHVVFGHRGTNARRELLGIFDAQGYHGTGWARAEGIIASPLNERMGADLDLLLEIDARELDRDLGIALGDSVATRDIYSEYGVEGGTASARMQFRDRAELGGLSAFGTINVVDAPVSWRGLPVDAVVENFDLELRWAGYPRKRGEGLEQRDLGASFVATGFTSSVKDLRVAAVFRDVDLGIDEGVRPTGQRYFEGFPVPGSELALSKTGYVHNLVVSGTGLALRGPDWDALVAAIPEIDEHASELQPAGFVDFNWTESSRITDNAREVALEVSPAQVQLLPKAFPMNTREVRGRGGFSSLEREDGSAVGIVDAVFTADWVDDMRVAARLRSQVGEQGESYLDIVAGGIKPTNGALIGALPKDDGNSFLSSVSPTGEEADWSSASLTGRVELGGRIQFFDDQDAELDLRISLRQNSLLAGSLRLDELGGELELEQDVLSSDEVRAKLQGTPLTLKDIRVALAEDKRWDEVLLQARLFAEHFPLDRKRLGAFLDPESLQAFMDDFHLRGHMDLDDLQLGLAQATDGRYRLELSGHLIPSGLHLITGTPLEINSASVIIEELVIEGGRARTWGHMENIAGSVGGRSLDGGSLLFSYVDRRLNIEDLDLNFAGGKLTSLGGVEGHGGAALALDLSDRHHFAAAIQLSGVDAKQLLEGAFAGDDDNSGTIDASVRLEAAPGALLEAKGGGFLRLTDARLWSIPVFRALFTTLGFDATAVFDSMSSGFTISDGRISFNKMRAHSPLLNLVGDGFLDMDSELGAKFEVRYSLIDKLGPLRELVYWFQNSLITVELKGDLYQPVVILRNAFLDLFSSDPKIRKGLPLPAASPLPARF